MAVELEGAEDQLEAARAALEQAAREVARLSAELVGPQVEEVVQRIRIDGRRAMLGLSIDDGEGGVFVSAVTPGGPADEAGIRSGDVITKINSIAVSGGDGVGRLIAEMRNVESGDQVSLIVQRGETQRTVQVTTTELSARPYIFAFGGDGGEPGFDVRIGGPGWPRLRGLGPWADMELVPLTPGLGSYFGTREGLLVVRAPEDETLALQDGDVIMAISGRKPRDTGHAMRILRSFEAGETLTLQIMREKRERTLSIELPEVARVSKRDPG
jgi:S1-C subfamily serine protease